PDCAAAPSERAPDPRCGETLDGREPAPASAARQASRAALWVPRAASAGFFWPIVETSGAYETYHVGGWLHAWLTSDDGKIGVRPMLTYATGFLPTAGLRVFDRRLPGAGSSAGASFQTAGPSVLMGELTGTGPAPTGLAFRGIANRRDDRLFAGIGALGASDLALMGRSTSRFASDILSAELRWSRRLPAHLGAVVHGDVERRDYRAYGVRGGPSIADVFSRPTDACMTAAAPTNACVDPALVPGFASGLRVAHGGAGALWDLRSRERDGSGAYLALDATFAQGLAGDPSRHVTLSGETVLALGLHDRQLILRGRAATVDALGDAPIPFEELVMVSGNNGMRGFPDGRFRGPSGVVGTAEYRWYVGQWVDASLFSDLGTVAGPDFSGLASARWFPSFGVGLRLYHVPGEYWEGTLETGAQLAYAPDYGFRFILNVATF
ncbi:MAG TPA: BamA/TamA family outer membrane protein, partial [Polyangia bacterium]|nr:BamA/TamA family outer membrane protein [Polyangia bacterium]